MSEDTHQCIHLMGERYGLDISIYETSFLEKAIQLRMDALSIQTIEAYLLVLGKLPVESSLMMNQLSNSYSEFFRNPLTFTYLEQMILPALIREKIKNKEKEIRVWSAACASGQEAYSVAILLDEAVKSAREFLVCHIFATDISQAELDNAQRGVYQTAAVNNVSLKRITSYFHQEGENYTVDPKLKEYIDFSIFDLLSEKGNCPQASVYGNFDLVFCTNLLFYYQPESRKRIVSKVENCLAPGGYLITGEAERALLIGNKFREVLPNSGIFQKR